MRVLIYSPGVFGHPQVYCRAITEILLERGCEVVVAAGLDDPKELAAWPDLLALAGLPRVEIVACSEVSRMGQTLLAAEELVAAQRLYRAEATLLVDADLSRNEFMRIAHGEAPRFQGWVAAIFARTSAWYPGEDFYSGAPQRRLAPTLRGNLGKVKRLVFNRRDTPAYFFRTVLIKKKTVHAIIVKDERVEQRFGPPTFWLPDIYRSFRSSESTEDTLEFDRVAPAYRAFLDEHPGKEVLLFCGRGAWYKGYDLFLKLAELDPSLCCVHCGEDPIHETGKPYEFDIDDLRAKLRGQGRLFETSAYIHSQRLVELFFSTAARLVSTHRLTGSSGTVLQALALGKPVLAPDTGLLGHRVRVNGIGMTYRYGDIADLYERWQVFKRQDAAAFGPAISTFMRPFTRHGVATLLERALLGPAHQLGR